MAGMRLDPVLGCQRGGIGDSAQFARARRHAEIVQGADGYEIIDVGSLNGTYVNRRRIERAALRPGDEVQIGKFKLVFRAGQDGPR